MRNKRKIQKRRGLANTLIICIVFIYILSFSAKYLDPRTHIYLAFLGLSFPIFALLLVVILAFLLFRRKWISSGIIFIILLFTWGSIRNHFGIRTSKSLKKSAQSLRIMTYNVHFFNTLSKDKNTAQEIYRFIKKQNPDILCIQEFYHKKHEKFNFKDSLLKNSDFKYSYFEPTMSSASETIGLMIVSKFPIRKHGTVLFDSQRKSGNIALYADILIGNRMIRMYNLHLQSIKFKTEDYEFIQQKSVTKDEIQPAKRIAKLIKVGFEKRANQVDMMLSAFQNCKIPYIVCGDFNDTPGSNSVYRITKNLTNTFAQKGSGWGSTFYGLYLPLQIDYIAHTSDFETQSFQIEHLKSSDHYPVITDLSIN